MELCGDTPMPEKIETGHCYMGVDTGRALHVTILHWDENADTTDREHLVHLAVCREFSELDDLMKRFKVSCCVIDGLPETHATREFARRHGGQVYLCFFNHNQRGAAQWDQSARQVVVNRTEALDASRAAIREKKIVLPRRVPIVEEFAQHMTCDAKVLDEDEETGIKKYRYIRTGENHFSMAFTYARLASMQQAGWRAWLIFMRRQGGSPWIA